MPNAIEQHGSDVLLRLKVVPGASRTQLAGMLGDRLKLRISAPPEAGKANKAIIKFLATALGAKQNQITIEQGETSAEKTVRVASARCEDVKNALVL